MAGARTAWAYGRLLRDQWRSADELLALQQRRMQRLIRHAYENHSFYRERFDRCGVGPGDIRSSEDLIRLPVVTKEEMRLAIAASAEIPETSRWSSTSGSTGTPMRFPFLPRDLSLLNLTWLRPLRAHGIPARARVLEITGPHNIRGRSRWYQRLGAWRKRSISIFAGEEEWLAALQASRPDVLWGYSGSLKLLAHFIEKNRRPAFRPRWVVGVSDLADDEGREGIRRVFATPLIDLYGAAEAGCISWICPVCGEYHINSDHLIVEFAPALPGNPRRILLTNLNSYAFPIIRYDIGDLGYPSLRAPACGRGLPLMRIVEGRSDAVIRLPSGRLLSPMFFFAAMKKFPWPARWRVVQEEPGRIRVQVVPDASRVFVASEAGAWIGQTIAEPVRIDIEVVVSIPDLANGKQCAVISRVANEA